MSQIEFEDRTNETPVSAATRKVAAVSQLLIRTTIAASEGNPSVGLSALAFTLGHGAARTGADLEEVLAGVRSAFEAGQKEQALLTSRTSDA